MMRRWLAVVAAGAVACSAALAPVAPPHPRTLADRSRAACARWSAATGLDACARPVTVRYGQCSGSVWGCYRPSLRLLTVVPGNGDAEPAVLVHEWGHVLGVDWHPATGIMAVPAWPPCITAADIRAVCVVNTCGGDGVPEC